MPHASPRRGNNMKTQGNAKGFEAQMYGPVGRNKAAP